MNPGRNVCEVIGSLEKTLADLRSRTGEVASELNALKQSLSSQPGRKEGDSPLPDGMDLEEWISIKWPENSPREIRPTLREMHSDLEREIIRAGLKRTGWNKSALARELGISRAGLIKKVEKFGLDKRFQK